MSKIKFKIAYGEHVIIEGTKIPRGSIYGKDSHGYYVCMNRNILTRNPARMWIVRFDAERRKWYESAEISATVDFIVSKIDSNAMDLNNVPPVDFSGHIPARIIESVLQDEKFDEFVMAKKPDSHVNYYRVGKYMGNMVTRKRGCSVLKRSSALHEKRHDKEQIKLDMAEAIICRVRF